MKFKVLKGTETYNKLQAFQEKGNEVRKIALDFANSLGFEEYIENQKHRVGGISAFVSREKKEGYKQVFTRHRSNLIFPKTTKANKELLAKIEALPVITDDEYNSIIGFKSNFYELNFVRAFGYRKSNKEDCYLIDLSGVTKYTPKPDMIEILESEYISLSQE
jgi:hypothetical protein